MAKKTTQPELNSGEVWAAVLGCQPWISGMPRAMAPLRDDVLRVKQNVAKLAKQAVHGTLEPSYKKPPKYKDLDDAFQYTPNEQDIQSYLAALPGDDGMPYVAVAGHQRELLQHAFPRAAVAELTGTVVLEPDPVAWYRFVGLYEVVDDPFSVFGLMASGALLQNQAHAVRAVYPTLSVEFDSAIRGAIVDAIQTVKSFTVPYKADIGIRDWLGMESQFKPYQAAFIAPMEDVKEGPGPSEAQVSPESKASLSAAQSALYRTVGR